MSSWGVELRVDVLTLMSADTIEDAAHSIYRTYDYGFGDDKRGVTLTIYMEPVGSTYVMAPGNWCIYVGGYDESFTGGILRDTVTGRQDLYTYTTESRRSTKSQSSGSFSGDGGGHGRSGKF